MSRETLIGKIGGLLGLVLLVVSPVGSQILGDVPEPELPPLLSTYLPFSAPAAIIDFWSLSYYFFRSTISQITNLELKAAQSQAILTSALTVARRYIDAGERRFNALIAPEGSGRKGKLQLDVETWERRYSNFIFGRDSLRDHRDLRLYDKYAFLKNEFIPKWEARVRPCIEYLKSEFARVRTAVNKPLTDPDIKTVNRSIQTLLIGETDPQKPVKFGGKSYTDESLLFEALASASPQQTLALCRERGPLTALGLLTMALERKAMELSDNGGTPRSEMKVTVFNRADRMAVEILVKPMGESLDPNAAGFLIFPEKIKPEDQIDPKGRRPGGSHGSAWVTASPEDEIWVRAMTLGQRRDQVRFQVIGGKNVRLVPETLPRNYYRLDYGTEFPNPIFTRWTVTGESYSWADFEGPWHVTGQPRMTAAPKFLRDRLFGPDNVTGDTLVWTLPDRDAVERLGELRATVNGLTKWHRQGPRSTMHHDEEERGGGPIALRVEFW
ncbi:MAG: hypothetical protein A2Y56_08990 [Candidatus Aminicenantes bacterium RBG_13_63_10]|nr:MAG: hypothetical protein A2Y56_08990 [Candidatus Aminicenantes bacterium RBG_13_63_10]